jgi:hypothetical protein
MRMLMIVKIPHEKFNAAVEDGSVGRKMMAIAEATKPEAIYYTEFCGHRGAVMVVDLKSPSQVPALAEPWFLAFNADVQFHVAMTPEDLKQAGLDKFAGKWN